MITIIAATLEIRKGQMPLKIVFMGTSFATPLSMKTFRSHGSEDREKDGNGQNDHGKSVHDTAQHYIKKEYPAQDDESVHSRAVLFQRLESERLILNRINAISWRRSISVSPEGPLLPSP